MIITKEDFEIKVFKYRCIDNQTDCWLFTGCVLNNGYGQIRFGENKYNVHRLSAHIYLKLDIDDKKQHSLHKIICPNKHCFNPNHLYIGTQEDNESDKKLLKHNVNLFKLKCKRGHRFNLINTYFGSFGKRKCRACNKLRKKIKNES